MQMLESELQDVLRASRLGPRQARAVSRRLGWDGRPPATLAAAGAGEGYTRERVRQLEERARRHAAGLRLPIATAALELVAAAAPAARAEVALELEREGIAARPFDPAGVLVAAELTGLVTGIVVRDGLVVERRDAGLAGDVLATAGRLAARHGAAHVDEVALRLDVRPNVVRRVLVVSTGATWLGDDWVVLPVRRTRATTGLRKMLAVARRLTLGDVEDGLRRPGCGVALPRDVLHALCESHDWIAVDAGVVSARVALDPDRLLSPLERQLVAIFRSEGPVLSFTRAVRLAEATGINATSAGIYLGKTPVLQTVSRGVYAVRGYGAEILPLAVTQPRAARGSEAARACGA